MNNIEDKEMLSPDAKKEKRKKINSTLGNQLAKARLSPKNHYSLYSIAKYLGTSHSHVARIESGERNTYFADIKILADFYGVSLDSLCDDLALEPLPNSSPWRDIPPILAFLSILNRFQPIIELGETDDEPVVKLSFTFNHLLEQKVQFKDFFKQYQVIANLIESNLECAEEVDILTSRLLEKYKDLNNPTSQKKNNR